MSFIQKMINATSSQQLTNYAFDATAKTVTLSDLTTAEVERIRLIFNITVGKFIFNPIDFASFGGTVATNILTYTTAVTGMTNTDKLLIIYDTNPFGLQTDADATSNGSMIGILKKIRTLLSGTIQVSNVSLPLPTGAATEATLALIKTNTDNLTTIAGKDFATEATLATLESVIETIQELASRIGVLPAVRGIANDLRVTLLSGTVTTVTTVTSVTNIVGFGGIQPQQLVTSNQNLIATLGNINNVTP